MKTCKYDHVRPDTDAYRKECSRIRTAARKKRVDAAWNEKAPVYRELATQPWRVEA